MKHVKLREKALRQVTGCWAVRKKMKQSTDIKMLHMICRKTIKDSIRNQTSSDLTDVEKLKKFLKKQRLRWFKHVE